MVSGLLLTKNKVKEKKEKMKTITIDGFNYVVKEGSKVLGVIIENKSEYAFVLKPDSLAIEYLNNSS